jgi:hypothetical protein
MVASESKRNNTISFGSVSSFASGTRGGGAAIGTVLLRFPPAPACFHVKRHKGGEDKSLQRQRHLPPREKAVAQNAWPIKKLLALAGAFRLVRGLSQVRGWYFLLFVRRLEIAHLFRSTGHHFLGVVMSPPW